MNLYKSLASPFSLLDSSLGFALGFISFSPLQVSWIHLLASPWGHEDPARVYDAFFLAVPDGSDNYHAKSPFIANKKNGLFTELDSSLQRDTVRTLLAKCTGNLSFLCFRRVRRNL